MHNPPPASVHVGRRLTPPERATIAAALEHFTTSLPLEDQLDRVAQFDGEQMPLSPSDAAQLAREIVRARKVKVCRSKRPAA